MRTYLRNPLTMSILASAVVGACARSAEPPIPPAPIRGFWPDPAFEPARQCHGTFGLAALASLLPRARLALRLPTTEAVELDSTRRCLRITVEDIETGRFTVLLLRGVGVPRRAVLLQLATPEDPDLVPRPPRGRGA
jgi:hypothetical protein